MGNLIRIYLTSDSINDYLQTTLEKLVTSATWFEHLPQAVIFLAKDDYLEMVASVNTSEELNERCKIIHKGECLCGRVAENQELLFINSIDDRHDIQLETVSPHGHYIIPIKYQDRLLGVLNLYLPEGMAHNLQDENFLLRVSDDLSQCIVAFEKL